MWLLFLVGTANAWTTTIPTDNAQVSCHLQRRRNLFSSRHFVSFTGSCCLEAAVVWNKRLIKKGGQLERLSRYVNPKLMGLRAVESSENSPFSPDWDEETFSSTKLDFQNTDSNDKMPLDIDDSESVSIDLDDEDDINDDIREIRESRRDDMKTRRSRSSPSTNTKSKSNTYKDDEKYSSIPSISASSLHEGNMSS
jgi:hypothetical protein